jgi:4-hydroxy-2-oxoheptanedioate aldolase
MDSYKSLKEKLRLGKTVIGTWCEIPSPEFINVLAKAKMDFVIIDMEHGAMDYEKAGRMVMAAEIEGCSPIIRVGQNNENIILRALEVNPEGIIVPHVENARERKMVVDAVKFAPSGNRSLNPFVRAGGYTSKPGFTKQQNDRTVVAILVEDKGGIKNIKTIVNDPDLDIVYMGSYDISVALGCPGETSNPKVLSTLERLAKIITAKNKIAGCMFHDQKDLAFFRKIGVKFLCFKADTSIVYDEVQRAVNLI